MSLNLDHLKTFALVVETGSFSLAAERLGISQPAVSLQMKELERRLGVRLLERVARRARPTAAGVELVEQMRHVNASVDAVHAAMATHSAAVTGRVTIGTGATACLYLLPTVLRTLRARYPALQVSVVTGNTADFARAVEDNSIDVALVTLPIKSRALTALPLMDDEFVAVGPRDGLPVPARASAQFLGRKDLVLFEPAANTRVLVDRWFKDAGHACRPIMELGSVEAIKEMVAAGLGWSVLPAMAVTGAGEHRGLVHLSLQPRLQRTLALILRKDKPVNKALRQVIKALQDRAGALPA